MFLNRAALVLMVLGGAASAFAQEGRIYGTVTDASKAVLPGVTVTVKNQRTGLTQPTVTDERGEYYVRALPRGRYSIAGELQSFKSVTKTDVDVGLDAEVRIDLVLELGAIEQSIVVTGEVPIVDARRSEVGANISQDQIAVLPVQGRQWIDLATLLPGTGQDGIRQAFYNSVNIGAGINHYSNGFYVDGVNNNWNQGGEPRQDYPQDSVAEFKVYAFNARSLYGFAQGGTLSTITRSGTNEFHGSAFEFYRDKALNSKTIFETTKPDYSRHQLGGSLGGPVIRNRAHFFGAVEYTDQTEFATVNTGGVFPEEEGTFEVPTWVFLAVGRYDQTISDKHRLFVRGARKSNELNFRFLSGLAGTIGGNRARDTGSTNASPAWSVLAGETWTVGNNTLNDFRVQYAFSMYQNWPTGTKWTKVGRFPRERVESLRPIIIRPSLTKGTNNSNLGPEARWEVKNDFSHLVGRHEITVGVDLNWVHWTPDNLGVAPTWSFSTDARFDPDNPATYPFLFTQRLAPTYDDIPSIEHSVYLDDTWLVTGRLTLNLGLRYDLQTGVFNKDLLERDVPEIRLVDRVLRPSGKLDPSLFPFFDPSTRGDKNNFGPRVGFTWNIHGDGRQVIRGAYGVYYNRIRAQIRSETNPRQLLLIIQNPSYPDPYQGRDPFALAAVVPNFGILGNDNRNPYTHQLSFGYGREIGPNLGMSIDGTIANGYQQHSSIDRNYFASPADRDAGRRPFPQYGQVTEGRTDGRLQYRGMEARVERRMANGWQLLASYTLAWAKIDAEDRAAEPFNPAAEYGFADADRRNRLVVSGIVEPFARIQISGIMRYQSSLAFNVMAGRDLNRDAVGNDRPPGITRNQGCRGLDLNLVNAYRTTNGLAAVSEVDCPHYLTFDLRASRTFRWGSTTVEPVFQVFNAFNRSNFFQPVGNARSLLFGQSLQVASPRQIELAIRLGF
jgi:hypothetical protein